MLKADKFYSKTKTNHTYNDMTFSDQHLLIGNCTKKREPFANRQVDGVSAASIYPIISIFWTFVCLFLVLKYYPMVVQLSRLCLE